MQRTPPAVFGLTENIANEFFDAGADCLTFGDHAWDQREALTYIERESATAAPDQLSRSRERPGKGAHLFVLPDGRRVGVIQAQGIVFMKQLLDNPFGAVDTALNEMPLGVVADAVIVDMHCEATSEKMAMGHHCDGRASVVVGSHTHVPTADHMILANGTAYQSDAGMCGDYDSVIGMQKDNSLRRFSTQLPGQRYEPALGEGTLCGLSWKQTTRPGSRHGASRSVLAGNCLNYCQPFEISAQLR